MPFCFSRPAAPSVLSRPARAAGRKPVEQLESRAYFAATPAVSSLTLVDATTDAAVGSFASGATLDAGRAYSVQANVPAATQSVRFEVDGKVLRTESYAPLTIAGDDGAGDYAAWSVPAGAHTLRVTPFAGKFGTGLAGPAATVKFSAAGPAVATADVAVSAAAVAHPLGGNLNSQSDRVQDLAFVDLVKTTRGFYNVAGRKASNGATAFANTDANGWPTEDFSFTAVDNSEWNVAVDAGVYHMAFKGPAGATVAGSAGVTVKKLGYVAATQTHTYDVTVGANVTKLSLTFKSTGGQVKGIRLLQPGYALSTTQTFTNKYVNLLQVVGPSVLRFMDWTKANGDPEVNWSDRPKVTDATQAKAIVAGDLQPLKGIAWEYCIQLANALNKSVWINVPAMASDDYVRQLAALFRDNLNAGLTIYVEYSNEVWNSGFSQSTYNKTQAVNEVFNNPAGELNYDKKPVDKSKPGSSNPQANTWGDRRHARRTKQISDLFKATFVAGGKPNPINTRVRVVLGGQVALLSRFDNELTYLNKFYGSPKTYLWGIGVAPYFNAGSTANQSGATKAQILSALSKSVDNYVNGSVLSTAFQKASAYGIKLLAYEGGPDTFGAANVAAKRAAQLDPQMQTILVKYLTNWYAKGGDLFNFYTVGARSYNTPYGSWSITEDLDVLNTPKIKAFQQVRG
jgi:hypothetical protein